jgi:antirestriction protein ArdC
MPWATAGPPRNLRGRFYRGINLFLLGMSPYDDPRWGTYRAIGEVGGQVRRGERGSTIVFWKRINVRDKDAPASQREKGKVIPLLRCYTVFNVEQADGIAPLLDPMPEFTPHEEAHGVMMGMPNAPTITHGGSIAAYEPLTDAVRLPRPAKFETPDSYYAAAFHELVHSTGHPSRLNRGLDGSFGSDPYAKEELIAEMGSAMLTGMCGLDTQGQDASYIAGWLKRLQDDSKLVVVAAAAAQKACDVILDTKFEDEPQQAAA